MKKEQVDAMTLQEAMDYAVSKMVEQGKQCTESDGGCVYGNENNEHCGVGHLLDSDNPALMGYVGGVHSLIGSFKTAGILPKLIENNPDAFAILQAFHDYDSKERRKSAAAELRVTKGISTDNPNWEAWITTRPLRYAGGLT